MELKDFLNIIMSKSPYRLIDRGDFSMMEQGKWKPKWKIKKYHGDRKNPRLVIPSNLYDVEVFDGNCLLNEGISEMWRLIIGSGGTAYNEANTYLGVGTGTDSATASQEGLQGGSTDFQSMDSSYPQLSNQTVTFRSTFGADDANFNWREFTAVNAANDTGENLNRKVESHGTKASPDVWVLSLTVTLS